MKTAKKVNPVVADLQNDLNRLLDDAESDIAVAYGPIWMAALALLVVGQLCLGWWILACATGLTLAIVVIDNAFYIIAAVLLGAKLDGAEAAAEAAEESK